MLKKGILALLFCTSVLQAAPEEIDLRKFEKSICSQNGEDGVLAKLFQLIEPTNRYCIEFGADDGVTGSNTYVLRAQDWACLLLDRVNDIPEYNLHKEFITAENINDIFDRYDVPSDIGLLSIDIDYNDFHVWNGISNKYKPAVVMIEFNATHLPTEDKVVKYRPFFCGDGKSNYYGASILAMYNLGRSKGYSLVFVESRAVNLFFVRNDIIREKKLVFKDMNDVEKLYRYPSYGLGPNGGHLQDLKYQEYATSMDYIK